MKGLPSPPPQWEHEVVQVALHSNPSTRGHMVAHRLTVVVYAPPSRLPTHRGSTKEEGLGGGTCVGWTGRNCEFTVDSSNVKNWLKELFRQGTQEQI